MTEARIYKRLAVVVLTCASAVLVSPVSAQQDGAGDTPLSREEFARFLEEYRSFKVDVGKLHEENGRLRDQLAELKALATAPGAADWRAAFEERAERDYEAIMERVRDEFGPTLDALSPGLTNFALGGAGVVTFQDRRNVDSTFGVGIAPTLLWKPTDRLLLEAEIAFGLTAEDSFVELDYAQVSYLLNDYMTVTGGKFLIPFNTFWERWHPSWINKSVTIPLMYERGLIGPTGLGVQVRGGFPVGKTKLNYAAYYVNGPDFENTSFGTAGNLGFENFRDNNNDKSFGGRIGFLPIPELELGYSFLTGRVGDSGSRFSGVDTFIHGIDLSYAREIEPIKG
ncbi:MAG: hypothetical protein IID42_08475, partial [Planctomycetes bacterium]|nr:hypothetical protein [Planctomycetota bacterium]